MWAASSTSASPPASPPETCRRWSSEHALERWADAVIEEDNSRLGQLSADQLNPIVTEFRELDVELIERARPDSASTHATDGRPTNNDRRGRSHPAGGAKAAQPHARPHAARRSRRGRAGAQAVLHDEPADGQPVPAASDCISTPSSSTRRRRSAPATRSTASTADRS